MAEFKGINLDTLPKRTRGPQVDVDAARKLATIVAKDGAATDATAYETPEKARAAGLRGVRLLNHVAPDGKRGALRTFALEGGKYGFAVYFKDVAADEDADSDDGTAAQ